MSARLGASIETPPKKICLSTAQHKDLLFQTIRVQLKKIPLYKIITSPQPASGNS